MSNAFNGLIYQHTTTTATTESQIFSIFFFVYSMCAVAHAHYVKFNINVEPQPKEIENLIRRSKYKSIEQENKTWSLNGALLLCVFSSRLQKKWIDWTQCNTHSDRLERKKTGSIIDAHPFFSIFLRTCNIKLNLMAVSPLPATSVAFWSHCA